MKESQRRWNESHKEHLIEYKKLWNAAHPNYQKEHYAKNKEREKKASSDWQKKNLKEIEAKHVKYHLNKRSEAIELLGGKCNNPYNLEHGDFLYDIRCLQIDHIHGGGSKHCKKRQAYGIALDVIKDQNRKETYQVLCANCNWIKRHVEKEYN